MNVRLPWTVSFIWKQLGLMSLASAWRYKSLITEEVRGGLPDRATLRLRLKRVLTGDVWLRYGTSDLRTFDEVVVREVYRDACAAVAPCQYVIDLGGNIGLAARYFSERFPQCRILSVEPDPQNLAMYNQNMGILPPERWAVLHAAAWRANEPVYLGLPPSDGEFDSVRVGSHKDSGDCAVPGMTVAEIIRRSGFPQVDLLKIDIEGAETELFAGDRSWLDAVRAVAIEFHADTRQRSDFDAVMARGGFAVRDINNHTVLATRRTDVGPGHDSP